MTFTPQISRVYLRQLLHSPLATRLIKHTLLKFAPGLNGFSSTTLTTFTNTHYESFLSADDTMSDILAALEQLDDLEREKKKKPTNTKYRNPLTSSYVFPPIVILFRFNQRLRFVSAHHTMIVMLTHVIATTNQINELADNHDHAPSPNQEDNPPNRRKQITSTYLPLQRPTASAHHPSPPLVEYRSLICPARLRSKDDYESPPGAQV